MIKPTLVIMAAGLASRFGGDKQVTPVDEQGHLIIDYSLYDAHRAGFDKVVFIIQPFMKDNFHAAIGSRIEKYMEVVYAFQTLDRFLPEGVQIPECRKKPWGTAHAALCARDVVDGPFAVINADDFYGRSAYESIYRFLTEKANDHNHAMVGFQVENTLTENGTVSRGVCKVNEMGYLTEITERTAISPFEGGARFTEDGGTTYTFLPKGTLVSMNMWGFGHGFMKDLEENFAPFLKENLEKNPEKCEYFLPFVPHLLIEKGAAKVSVLPTLDKWYGVTYKQDLDGVKKAIADMKKAGQYTENLWD
ncbi:MAG: nucleotidyltransferase [Clostridiales bacterium]|nr:nucleotidyltransferase [Clostridiales bacterium]